MTAPLTVRELVERYRSGERAFAGADVEESSSADAVGAMLDGADLSRSWIVASFRGASLRGARFVRANVKTCDFSGADLTGADFSEAALDATTFAGATLSGARFAGASVQGYVLGEKELPDW